MFLFLTTSGKEMEQQWPNSHIASGVATAAVPARGWPTRYPPHSPIHYWMDDQVDLTKPPTHSGAILIWTINLMLAAVHGTGNMMLPMMVVCWVAVALIPLSAF
jgi:hypothetical protein